MLMYTDCFYQARNGVDMFALVVLSRMDGTTLWAGDAEIHATVSKRKVERVRYGGHARQIANVVQNLRVLNLATHSETCMAGLELADYLLSHGALPAEREDVVPSCFIQYLLDACAEAPDAATQSPNADSMVDAITVDEARGREYRSEFLFRRTSTQRSWQWSSWSPDNPPCTPLGEAVRDASLRSPVCIIGGLPGVGKTKRMPIGLLGALLEYESSEHHGIAVIMEQKEAQNALYEHIKREGQVVLLVFVPLL